VDGSGCGNIARMVRILAFAGSTRRGSFNRQLVRIAASGAREAGAEVTEINLADYRLPVFDQDEEEEYGKPDAAKALKQLMIEHDGFLIAAPEYNSSVTGVLKNAIDWVSRPDEGESVPLGAFKGKVVTLMSASPGALGGLRCLVHLRAILGNIGCIVLPDQVAVPKAHHAFNGNGELADLKQHQRIVGLGTTLATVTARLRAENGG